MKRLLIVTLLTFFGFSGVNAQEFFVENDTNILVGLLPAKVVDEVIEGSHIVFETRGGNKGGEYKDVDEAIDDGAKLVAVGVIIRLNKESVEQIERDMLKTK